MSAVSSIIVNTGQERSPHKLGEKIMATATSTKNLSALGTAILYAYGVSRIYAATYIEDVENGVAAEGNTFENLIAVFQTRFPRYSEYSARQAARIYLAEIR
jgi:hypothetical protein